MQRTLLVLLVTVALAGCASDDAGDSVNADPTTTTSDTSTAQTTTTTSAAPAPPTNGTLPNTPPTANITVGVFEAEAPATVTFTLSGADADGDNLTWMFDADGDGAVDAQGDALPAEANFTFETAGNYTATLTVDDGQNQTLAELTLAIIEPVEQGPPPFVPLTFTQERALNCPQCIVGVGASISSCVGLQAGENGVDCAWFELDPAWEGRTWSVDGSLISFIEFFADCSGTALIEATYTSGATTGTIPAGAGCLVEWDPVDPVVTITLVVS